MSWTTLHMRVVTPLFGGEDPSGPGSSPIRVPSIRGVLRFWLRALAAGHGVTDPAELWTLEQSVFGSTRIPSAVSMRVPEQPKSGGSGSSPTWAAHRHQGFGGGAYLLGQGLWSHHNGMLRDFVAPGAEATFTLQVRFSADEKVNARLLLALWAWLTYGGLGARTRRGFGQLACVSVDGPLPSGWSAADLQKPSSADAWRRRITDVIPARLRAAARFDGQFLTEQPEESATLPALPALAPRWWGGRLITGRTWSFAEALHEAGRAWRLFRSPIPNSAERKMPTRSLEWLETIHQSSTQYPVATLGLPVNYFKPPRFSASVDPFAADGTPLRRASPVWIRPVQVGREWIVLTHVFWARLLPEGATLRLKHPDGPRSLDVPSEDDAWATWDAWHADDRRPTPGLAGG